MDRYEDYLRFRIFQLLVAPFERFNPNMLSITSLVFAIATGLSLYFHYFIAAFIFLAASNFFDGIDGYIARKTDRVTEAGFLYDHISDRLSDSAMFIGIAAAFDFWGLSLMTLVIIIFSSYIGVLGKIYHLEQNKAGIFNRTIRIYLLLVTILLMVFFPENDGNIMRIFLMFSIVAGLYTSTSRLIVLMKNVKHI